MNKNALANQAEQTRAEALKRAKRLIKSFPTVKGVDFGWTYKNGRTARRRGIRFHVVRKLSAVELPVDQLIPREILGVPCDVVEASYTLHAQSPRSSFDPIRPGISTGNALRRSTGTLGLFVYGIQSAEACILSNWHVLCGAPEARPGEPITQPGPQHLHMMPPRNIAELLRSAPLSSGYDAAIAKVSSGVALDNDVFGLDLTPTQSAVPEVGMRLTKSGALSGVTRAIVDGVGGTYEMNYSAFGDQVRWMDGIRLVADPDRPEDEISLEGDSGAIWIEPKKRLAIALHFGGEDGLGSLAEYAVAHSLPRVLELLDVSLTPP